MIYDEPMLAIIDHQEAQRIFRCPRMVPPSPTFSSLPGAPGRTVERVPFQGGRVADPEKAGDRETDG